MRIGEILVERHGIKQDDVNRALKFQEQYGGKLGAILVNMGVIAEETLIRALSEQLCLGCLCARDYEGCNFDTLLKEFPLKIDYLLERKSLPIGRQDGRWLFAAVDPLNLEVNAYLAEAGVEAAFVLCTDTQLRELSMKLKSQGQDWARKLDINAGDIEKLRELASEAPVVNLVNTLISRAIARGASDLHFEPYKNMYRVRFRIDGILHDVEFLPLDMQLPVSSRIKILAGLDIAEKRKPQDGKISMRVASQELDIRVSTLPLGQGESLVLRFLLKESIRYDLEVLGLEDDLLQKLNEDIVKPNGVILLTGPTGSGKTTTLYSSLNRINSEDKKIITVEDPVEYQLDGINQVQVNPGIGYDFPSALRSIVRQDPDVVMIGEIRDRDTAKIAMQASLTGHLVFSTVHTNDAPSALTRLMDLGVEEYLLNAALVSVIAQRLIRKLCPHCKREVANPEHWIELYEGEPLMRAFSLPRATICEPVGCDQCDRTGYLGRVAIMEYMRYDETIKGMAKDSRFVQDAKRYLAQSGVRDLFQDGMLKVFRGVTSIQEILRVTG